MTLQPLARHALIALAAAGLALPWYFNLAFFASGGSVAPGEFFGAAFANALTTAITLDVYLAAFAFSVGVAADASGGRPRWLAVPLCFGIGLAFALPMYLWWRSRPSAGVRPATGLARRPG
ncbi:DUF2834 domain-containing protein [Azohydromonas caseinilytica]|uniref:DUF2834 domain-containing protein n=1 Tax=Azohydromonas caseinilytica TaxID=2728836 RepID=A0A848FKA1_9BURK|nr:DUF2834 domain-containing protein [Azohydromonas caseinilytica]NML18663.1 DUF2834 domain-containing protein [Azohydromonas caseinilytica]